MNKEQRNFIEELGVFKCGLDKDKAIFKPKTQIVLESIITDIDFFIHSIKEEKSEPEHIVEKKKPENKKRTQEEQIKLAEILLVFEKDLKKHLGEFGNSIGTVAVDTLFDNLDLIKENLEIDKHIGSPEAILFSDILDRVQAIYSIYAEENIAYGQRCELSRNSDIAVTDLSMEIDMIFKQMDKVDYLNTLLDENKRIPF